MLALKPAARVLIFLLCTSVSVSARQATQSDPVPPAHNVALQNALPSMNDEGADADSESE
jgi:hypothetical protein